MLFAISFFSSFLLILLILFILFIVFLVIIPSQRVQSYKQEGVSTYFYPVLGLLHYWKRNYQTTGDIMSGQKLLAKTHPNQRLMVTNINHKLFFILHDPKYIKEFLQNSQLYHKSQILDWFRTFVGNGLVTSEGEVWKRHRRIISNSFHFEFLKGHLDTIQRTAREFLDKVRPEDYKDFPVIEKVQEITGQIVGRIFFGEQLNSYTFEGNSLTVSLAGITAELAVCGRSPLCILFGIRFLRFPLIPRFRRISSRVDSFRSLCMKIVADRKAKPQQSNDLLSLLLATQKSDDPEKRFSDEEIVNEFLTFFIAGMDTTGHLIAMTLYNLTQHSQYLKDLKEERDKLYNKEGVTTEDIQKMEVIHSLLKETLRFYTPAPICFGRVALKDHKILDIDVKKGSLVLPELLAAAFDEKNFEEPYKFKPERWRTAEVSKVDPYAFVPFSAGPRNCIGQHLAIIESKVIISEFLNRFDFKLKDGYKLKMNFRFLYEPDSDLLFDLFPKKV